jgi:hypothetical protein
MASNLMVSFEIGDWRRQGPLIVAAIEELGPTARIFGTTWFVCSQVSAPEAAACIKDVLGAADGLLVVDVAANVAATFNVDERSIEFMSRHWCRPRQTALPSVVSSPNRAPRSSVDDDSSGRVELANLVVWKEA